MKMSIDVEALNWLPTSELYVANLIDAKMAPKHKKDFSRLDKETAPIETAPATVLKMHVM
jgi:hypothetical protein